MSGDELARIEQTAVEAWRPAAGQATDALGALGRWVQAAKDINELVAPLVDTPFVPDNYRPKIDPRATPEQKIEARRIAIATATAAVLQGTKFGWDPLTSLQQIIIVHGRPSMYAEAMKALLIGQGHEIWEDDLTEHRAVVSGRRRGEDRIHTVTITMDMARKAQWTKNETYSKTPQDMLYARAVSRVCKRVAPDVLLGIYSVEEVRDTIAASAQTGPGQRRTISPPARRAVTATTTNNAIDELLADDEIRQANPAIGVRIDPVAVEPVHPQTQPGFDAPLDETQWRHINDELRRLGITGEGQYTRRLERISEVVNRAVARGSDLTYHEGEFILAQLRAEPTPGEEDVATVEIVAAQWESEPTGDALLDGDGWPPTAQPPATPDTPEATP